jgi:hypothetical protein
MKVCAIFARNGASEKLFGGVCDFQLLPESNQNLF